MNKWVSNNFQLIKMSNRFIRLTLTKNNDLKIVIGSNSDLKLFCALLTITYGSILPAIRPIAAASAMEA